MPLHFVCTVIHVMVHLDLIMKRQGMHALLQNLYEKIIGVSGLQATEDKVKERLEKYLSRDENGIRKIVLNLFITGDKFTTSDVYKHLEQESCEVSYRGVSAMVGLMNTRLGILSINVTGDHNIYSLKDDYKPVVESILTYTAQ